MLHPNVQISTRIHVKNVSCVNIAGDVWKKWPPRGPKPEYLLAENEIIQNFEFRWCFIDTCQKCNGSNAPLALRFSCFLKIITKTMSISLQTYENRGWTQIWKINIAGDGRTFLWLLFKKLWFSYDSTNLGFQPGLSLTRNVRTP